jgi:hypothetical protein
VRTGLRAMQALNDRTLVEVWESGAARSPLDRALLLLAVASPDLPASSLADVSVSERDERVFELRMATFGEHMSGIVDCPNCAEALEFRFDSGALGDRHRSHAGVEFQAAGGLRFRLPNSRDLAMTVATGAGDESDEAAAVHTLLRRCCLNAGPATQWDQQLCDEAEAGLEALADRVALQFRFHCASCGTQWETPLDACAWLWSEIDRRARAVLDEVHRLARSYGWDEQAILHMHPARRHAYLERCGT